MAPATIEVLTDKITQTPDQVVEEDLNQVELEINDNLDQLGARKHELLKGIDSLMKEAQAKREAASAENDQDEVKRMQDRIGVLFSIREKLNAKGARPSFGEMRLDQVPGAIKEAAGALGTEVTNRSAMTLKNLGLIIEKHPIATTLTGAGLLYSLYKFCSPGADGQKPSLWKRLLGGAITVGLTAVGINMAAHYLYPAESAHLTKPTPTV